MSPYMSWEHWATFVRHFCVCQFICCPSFPTRHNSCSTSLWVTCSLMYGWLWYLCILHTVFLALLDWRPTDRCSGYMLLTCSFFFVVSSSYFNYCYHNYDHYSSCDCCVLQYLISPLGCYHGPLLDGATTNIGSV